MLSHESSRRRSFIVPVTPSQETTYGIALLNVTPERLLLGFELFARSRLRVAMYSGVIR